MPASFMSGSDADFSIDGAGGTPIDISAFVESVALPTKRTSMRLPRLGGNAVAKLSGPTETQITLSGWYHPTATVIFEVAANEAPATLRSVIYGPQGSVSGQPKFTAEVYVTDYQPDTAAEAPGKWTATLEVDGAGTWGVFP